jgi:hypothetical protein
MGVCSSSSYVSMFQPEDSGASRPEVQVEDALENQVLEALPKPEDADVEPVKRPPYVVYLKLSPEKILVEPPMPFQKSGVGKVGVLQGKYSYCVLENRSTAPDVLKSQYLLLKPMHESDDSWHGCFEIYKKKIPGYNKASSDFIVGGEIKFDGEEITWNVQSDGYSNIKSDANSQHEYGLFNYNNKDFKSNLEALLWMPGKYVHPDDSREEKSKLVVRVDDAELSQTEGTRVTRSVTHLHELEGNQASPSFSHASTRYSFLARVPCQTSPQSAREGRYLWNVSF